MIVKIIKINAFSEKIIYFLVPVLFSLFPILSLYNKNRDILFINNIIIPITLSLIICIIIYFIFFIIFRKHEKTSIFISLFFILFYSIGHLNNYIGNLYIVILNITITASEISIFIFFNITILLFLHFYNANYSLDLFFSLVKIFGASCFLIQFFLLLSYFFSGNVEFIKDEYDRNSAIENLNETIYEDNLPDIYYIILDGYGRKDILNSLYDYDNSLFIENLNHLGFYVAENSRSNYCQTYLSMSSSLNMDYLQNLNNINEEYEERNILVDLIHKNAVFDNLKKNGYKIVSISGTWTDDNIYSDISMKDYFVKLNNFEYMLINITPFILFKSFQLDHKRNEILNGFKQLKSIKRIKGPTFVYAHFLIPHPPFIFSSEGEPVNPSRLAIERDGDHYLKYYPDLSEYRKKYIDQLKYVNKIAFDAIKNILDESDILPIIILQSDHGPGSSTRWEEPENTDMKERLSILNAYFFPREERKHLYEDITPVNSFRMVFNSLFGQDYPLLIDKSYFSTWSQPYNFIEINRDNQISSPK